MALSNEWSPFVAVQLYPIFLADRRAHRAPSKKLQKTASKLLSPGKVTFLLPRVLNLRLKGREITGTEFVTYVQKCKPNLPGNHMYD